jgi:hypothetical protein
MQVLGPRKQRTRQHVIADLSVHYVEGFFLEEGHTVQRKEHDYGYDLLVFTYDEEGFIEPGLIYMQVKAAESLQPVGSNYVFDLDIRDFHLWQREKMPVILVLFDASRKRAYWLAVQDYFRGGESHWPKKGAKTVRVRVPRVRVMSRKAVSKMRDLKREVHLREIGGRS